MPEGGRVTIAASLVADVSGTASIAISVIDEGCGMPEHIAQRAFDPFFTTKDPGRGTGLGLSMVYGFIQQSGGRISIHSALGAGTEVVLLLPRALASDTEHNAARSPVSRPPGGTETILAVEDDDLVRANVESQLRRLGYRVLIASEAGTGLEMLAAEPGIDLLFTDMVMPGAMDGAELARRALALRPGLKILYTSGYFDETAMPGDWLSDSRKLLRKPYRRGDLAAAIRTALDAE
jgi:CheY-like chemotaxis protein